MNALPCLGLTSNKPSPRAKKLGLGSQDVRGLLFDRDIVAFYGDPAWQAKMAKGKKNLPKKVMSFGFPSPNSWLRQFQSSERKWSSTGFPTIYPIL